MVSKPHKLFFPSFFPEKLRRKDLEVARALEEKQELILDILHLNSPHLSGEDPTDDHTSSAQPGLQKDAKEILLAALAQGK